jgi:branched-chain amino acid transport system substrate-binding protein
MKETNSILFEDFSEGLKKISFEGVTGHIQFNSNGDRLDPESTVFIMKNGDWVRY